MVLRWTLLPGVAMLSSRRLSGRLVRRLECCVERALTCRLVFMVIIFMICSWAGRIRWPMDGSVNSSLGAQIAAQLRGLPVGTCIVAVRICWESLVFERFLGIHGPERGVQPGPLWADPVLMATSGYAELAPRVAGLVLGGGLLRFVTQADGPVAQQAIRDAFPEFSARAVPFARDWLGRHFAVDKGRSVGSVSQLLLLEPGSGEAFEIDEGLEDFFNVDLVEAPDTYLESGLFEMWRGSGGEVPGADQCVGFKVPLFLGGAGSIYNLELSDVQVYWDLCGQMWAATKGLPPGTKISGVVPDE